MSNFTKADLKAGMIVEIRNGNCYMIHEFMDELILVHDGGFQDLSEHDDNLLRDDNQFGIDIMTVRKPIKKYQLIEYYWKEAPIIWERKELPRLTEVERIILENAMIYDKKPEWISRDESETLCLHINKPRKGQDGWIFNYNNYTYLHAYNHLFQFIKSECGIIYSVSDLLSTPEKEKEMKRGEKDEIPPEIAPLI